MISFGETRTLQALTVFGEANPVRDNVIHYQIQGLTAFTHFQAKTLLKKEICGSVHSYKILFNNLL